MAVLFIVSVSVLYRFEKFVCHREQLVDREERDDKDEHDERKAADFAADLESSIAEEVAESQHGRSPERGREQLRPQVGAEIDARVAREDDDDIVHPHDEFGCEDGPEGLLPEPREDIEHALLEVAE